MKGEDTPHVEESVQTGVELTLDLDVHSTNKASRQNVLESNPVTSVDVWWRAKRTQSRCIRIEQYRRRRRE
jgi:hypothetical protein